MHFPPHIQFYQRVITLFIFLSSIALQQVMSTLTLQYTHLRERILLGSVSIKKDEYPFAAFCIGYLLAKTQVPTELIFEFLEEIDNLAKTKIFSQIIVKQMIQMFQDFPEEADKIVDTLKEISRGKMVNIIGWIESFYNEDPHPERKMREEPVLQAIPNTIELQNEGTQQLDDLFQPTQKEVEIERQIKRRENQDIELARKMQQEFDKQNQQIGEEQDAPCEICYVSLFGGDVEMLDCGHLYHKECLSESFKISISSNSFPLRCPNDECKKQVAQGDLRNIFNKQLYEKYQGHTLKAYADEHGDSISWCPTADCGYMFFYQKGDQERFQCLECKKQYCLNCRVDWHEGMSCKEYKITNTISEDDEKFINFVKGKKFKQCPKCKFWVEKNEGCDHMTCKCKFQFCYKCGGVYMKCECVEKARADMQNRRREAEQRMRRKLQRKEELVRKKREREEKQRQKDRIKEEERAKKEDEANRRTRRRK